jgi:PPP family 3-phenylpropionic acid transporter
MGNAIYGIYFPVYLHEEGYSSSQIGILLSFGPLVAMFGQPLWGVIGDRDRMKNRVLQILVIGSGLAMLAIPLSNHFYYVLVMIGLFSFFQTSIFPLTDAITLEELDRRRGTWSFGVIRIGGTLGFAAMSVGFGILAGHQVNMMFGVYTCIMVAALVVMWGFPRVSGRVSSGIQTSVWTLLRHKRLMLYLCYGFMIHMMLGFNYAFFPIYFNDLGGSNAWLGWAMLIAALSEVPFLLLSHRILQRITIPVILVIAGIASSLRWFLTSWITEPYLLLPVQILHGVIFIVLSVSLATFINREIPSEWKASGQALHGMFSMGAARILGGLLGGIASDSFGIRQVYLFNSWFSLIWITSFAIIVYRLNYRSSLRGMTFIRRKHKL